MLRRSVSVGVGVALVAAWIMFSFAQRATSTGPTSYPPLTGVVFTGQFDRIDNGLELLNAGGLSYLFISGVNQGAGLNPDTFARQFHLSEGLVRDLADGRIILATEAQNTIENALEASCWLTQHPDIQQVVLITSPLHMPRASLALERASRVNIKRLTVGTEVLDLRSFLTAEFWKFAGTWFLTLLPKSLWPVRSDMACNKAP